MPPPAPGPPTSPEIILETKVEIAMNADVGGRRAGGGERFKLGADPRDLRCQAREPGGERAP
jgi:hypothetical protein